HGPQLTAVIEGLPAGLPVSEELINVDLARRQGGYGRGGRMAIEKDQVEILAGVRWGETIGSPVTLCVRNRDWPNWQEQMSPSERHRGTVSAVTKPRPGHVDLPGALKYGHHDVRNLLERSSARETAVRVAVGAVAKALLGQFGITVYSFVVELGGIPAIRPDKPLEELRQLAAASPLYTFDQAAEEKMKAHIDRMKDEGDSVGGIVEVVVSSLPVGLGSHAQWDRKLDARLAMAVMSIQAIKGVEIGCGFSAARKPGSQVHDEIFFDPALAGTGKSCFFRKTNNAGGIEGGISNGEEVVVRAAMKPIPTLYTPLRSVDIITKEAFAATVERSDVCAVPAAAVVTEAVVAIEVANAFLDKFGGDSLAELRRNYDGYCAYLRDF
ncbi:MAG TPA: chorismate synthase, partial [Geobacteraceae bacterium]